MLPEWLKQLDPVNVGVGAAIAALLGWHWIKPLASKAVAAVRSQKSGEIDSSLDVGYEALKVLDAQHKARGIEVAERKRLFLDGIERLLGDVVE